MGEKFNISNLNLYYGDFHALKDVDLSINEKEITAFIGPSGCGKSTFLKCLNRMNDLVQGCKITGQVLLDGEDIYSGMDVNLLRKRVGMVFQSYDLFPNKTVLGNITLAPTLVQKRDKAEAEQEAIALLERVGLADRKDAWPHELSGGQRQRVAICRALILHPEVLLFDEVTAALDPEMVREVLDVMLDLAKQGKTMIIVTHEMQFARAIANRVIFLDGGKIVEEAAPAEFFDRPKTERAQRFLRTFTFDAVK